MNRGLNRLSRMRPIILLLAAMYMTENTPFAASECTDFLSNCPDLDATIQVCSNENQKHYCNVTCGLCPIDGNWTEWSDWTPCAVTCGGGTTERSRTCTNPAPSNGGNECDGLPTESMTCNPEPCPIDGNWTEWGDWTACLVTCGGGTISRSRTCTNPAPSNGGNECDGLPTETATCNPQPCPVDGNWTEWSDWTPCIVTCGGGPTGRFRSCTNPAPSFGGNECEGNPTETGTCNPEPCPIDGQWTDWSNWTACDVTCDGGTISRSRTCTNPEPSYGGNECDGLPTETETCNPEPCPSTLVSPAPAEPPVPVGFRRFRIILKLLFKLPQGVDFRLQRTFLYYSSRLQEQFTRIYRRKIKKLFKIRIRRLWKGSLGVEYDLEVPEESVVDAVLVNEEIASKTVNITLLGETGYVEDMKINDKEVEVAENVTNTEVRLCRIYESSIGSCESDSICKVGKGRPYCEPIPTKDNTSLILGLGIAIPLFLLCVAIIILATLLLGRKKRQKAKEQSRQRGEQSKSNTPTTKMNSSRLEKPFNPRFHEDLSSINPTYLEDQIVRSHRS